LDIRYEVQDLGSKQVDESMILRYMVTAALVTPVRSMLQSDTVRRAVRRLLFSSQGGWWKVLDAKLVCQLRGKVGKA